MTDRTTSYGIEALELLRATVAELKGADPLRSVAVVAPSNIAGITAKRHLAWSGGVAGLQVTTLARLAETMGAPLLAGRRPATRAVAHAAWRRALGANPGSFGEVAEHPATVTALVRAHHQLRDLDDPALAVVAGNPLPARDVVRLHREVEASLAMHWYDAVDLLEAATGACGELGEPVVLFLPGRLTNHEQRFVAALASATEVVLIRGEAATEVATEVLHASDADDEVRCLVRDVVTALQSGDRVGVLYSNPLPYARLLGEQLTAAGIKFNGPGSRRVSERSTARAFLELLGLAGDDVPRAALFQALGSGSVRDFDGGWINVARWERHSRSAGVLAGEHWDSRLRSWIDATAHEGDRASATALREFVMRLRGELAATFDDWRCLTDWALDLFARLVADDQRMKQLPPEEQHACTAVRVGLRGLAALDPEITPPTLEALTTILAGELEAASPRVGRFGDGVYVGPIASAAGLTFDVVHVLGLSEDLCPGTPHDDVLLPDRIRRQLSDALPTLTEQVAEQREQLLAALAAAPRVVASFPRGDLRQTKARLPSRWLLPTLRLLSGTPDLPATKWEETAYSSCVSSAGSFAGALIATDHLATEQEWRTRAALADALDDDVVDTGLALVKARGSEAFTRFDGNLTGAPGLPDYRDGVAAVSPTSLERYAGCPHGFFVEKVLKVRAIENPEDIVSIPASELGTFIHECLDDLVRRGDLPGAGAPWTDAHRDALLALAEEKAATFEERGVTGHERLWRIQKEKIRVTLAAMLVDDSAWRAKHGAAVHASELSFGLPDATQEAVAIAVPSGTVRMRGAVDLVHVAADRIYVIDVKTGSRAPFTSIKQDNPAPKGSKLQLPVYAHAARDALGDDRPVTAAYWFVHRDDGRVEVELTADVEETYAGVLDVLVSSIAQGLYPTRPPSGDDYSYVQCNYCNPDGVGYAARRREWATTSAQPELARLVALTERNEVTP